jgi:hypothetical protein
MQKIQIRLTVATTILMILFNLSHSCCAQEIDDEPDRPRNEKQNIYAESNCPECEIYDGKNCIPDPRKQLPPNTPSTGIECCGSTPVPEGWMCCGTKIYKPYDFTDTVRIKIASKVNLGIVDAKADVYVSGKESKWNQCCDGEIRDLKTLIGGGLLEIKARTPWPKLSPIKFVFEGGGRGNINAHLEKTCENDNWCMETNAVIFGPMGLGAGDPDLILLDFGVLGEATLNFIKICLDSETLNITKLDLGEITGCIYGYYRFTSDLSKVTHRRTFPSPFTPHCGSENIE